MVLLSLIYQALEQSENRSIKRTKNLSTQLPSLIMKKGSDSILIHKTSTLPNRIDSMKNLKLKNIFRTSTWSSTQSKPWRKRAQPLTKNVTPPISLGKFPTTLKESGTLHIMHKPIARWPRSPRNISNRLQSTTSNPWSISSLLKIKSAKVHQSIKICLLTTARKPLRIVQA